MEGERSHGDAKNTKADGKADGNVDDPISDNSFQLEPTDDGRLDYARGGPVRSGEPERDFFIEKNMDKDTSKVPDPAEKGIPRT